MRIAESIPSDEGNEVKRGRLINALANGLNGLDEQRKELQRQRRDVLRRFFKCKDISSEDKLEILRRYASTGMVTFGFNFRTGQPQAELTKQGKWFVKAFRIR